MSSIFSHELAALLCVYAKQTRLTAIVSRVFSFLMLAFFLQPVSTAFGQNRDDPKEIIRSVLDNYLSCPSYSVSVERTQREIIEKQEQASQSAVETYAYELRFDPTRERRTTRALPESQATALRQTGQVPTIFSVDPDVLFRGYQDAESNIVAQTATEVTIQLVMPDNPVTPKLRLLATVDTASNVLLATKLFSGKNLAISSAFTYARINSCLLPKEVHITRFSPASRIEIRDIYSGYSF